jgi:hypothetical protein
VINWAHNQSILIAATATAVREFLSERGINDLCAVGYEFEFGQPEPSFFLCANTLRYRGQSSAGGSGDDDARWNSGEYEFPAGLLDPQDELGPDWNRVMVDLHRLTEHGEEETLLDAYNGLVHICCQTLAELARDGLFGDWTEIDFNVSSVDDSVRTVKQRDRLIRRLIGAK